MKFSEFKYERINMEEVTKQMEQLLAELKQQTTAEDFYRVFQKEQELEKKIDTMGTLASVRHSIDTRDPFYEAENDFWDEAGPQLQAYGVRLARIVLDFPQREELMKYIPEPYFLSAEFDLKTFDDKIIPLLQQENKLSSEYGKLKAQAEIEFEGKTYNLSSIAPLLQDKDRDVRRRAYDARIGFYAKNEAEFDRIYDELVKVRTQIAHELGYETFTQLAYYRMQRFDYDQDMVANYRRQILEDVVPLTREIYSRQAKRLGLDKLKYYDMGYEFPSGNPTPKGSPEDLVKAAVNMYHQMSPQTGEFIDMMYNNELWDLVSRDGKEMGGYCTSIPEYEVPFIFSNFNGTSGDVDVLTHEAGHAFQYYSSRHIPVMNCQWPTMESAEIDSMSMEFFAYPWMKDFFREDTQKYYYSHFCGTLTFLPYGVLVDHFQHEVYNHPEMTPDERKATWRKLEKMYIPDRDFEGCDILEKGCWWYQQGHIFESPFYYIDYCLAQVCALQFWVKAHRNEPGY
ncbi:MAG: M3 family oligoendopeptidase, partial [Erysipelotrichaceae bacterium]|nr:M3 family oligoendopeptidase [Erysipelotrichaceae bacterium]